MIAGQSEVVAQLRSGLDRMREKLGELQSRRDQLVARAKTAQAQNKMMDAAGSIDVLDPASELGRFEEKVRREEARALGRQELASSSLDAQFERLDGLGDTAEVEARLAALKSGT